MSNQILDAYVNGLPSRQLAVDIFEGEWSSRLPGADIVPTGPSKLFEDDRINWSMARLGGAVGKRILELGPLEGGHSYMLEKLGAESIVAVEANTRSYLKCLITKEIYDLRRVRFLLGDFVEYLRVSDKKFDICVASGVLYHMLNPCELIELIAARSNNVMIWSHYYDAAALAANENVSNDKFSQVTEESHGGYAHQLYQYNYRDALDWDGFCGGAAPFSRWMTKEGILGCLRHFGFIDIHTNFDTPQHQNGPCICLVATK
jgi:hypothetical protein